MTTSIIVHPDEVEQIASMLARCIVRGKASADPRRREAAAELEKADLKKSQYTDRGSMVICGRLAEILTEGKCDAVRSGIDMPQGLGDEEPAPS